MVVIQVGEKPNGGVEEGADVMVGGEVPEKVHCRGEETSAQRWIFSGGNELRWGGASPWVLTFRTVAFRT